MVLHTKDVTFNTTLSDTSTSTLLFYLSMHAIVVSSCSVNICGTGGSCSVIGVSSVCSCYSGYSGLFCENGKYVASLYLPL